MVSRLAKTSTCDGRKSSNDCQMGSNCIDRLGSDKVDREYVAPIPNGTIILLQTIGGFLRTSEVAKSAERGDILFL